MATVPRSPVRVVARAPGVRHLVLLAIALVASGAAAPAHQTGGPPQSPGRPALEKLIADGRAAMKAGDPKLALGPFQQAVPLAEQLGDDGLLGSALNGLGWAQWATGQYETALQTRRRALEVFTTRGDAAGQALSLRGIGETY